MLRHHVQKSASDAVSYYSAADYYAEGAPGQSALYGLAAARLGVEHSNEFDHFQRLCHNQHPTAANDNDEPLLLTQRMRDGRIVGIDLTFDGPKGFSVLEALTGDRRLRDALRQAVTETITEIEQFMATRVRKGGLDENRTTGNMIYYLAEHDTTRPVDGFPDMQPHLHAFILNVTWDDQENQWKAANLYDVMRDMPYFQAAFHQRLAGKVQELGYSIERKGNFFEIDGIKASTTAKFSRRQSVIEQAAKDKGITDPKKKSELGAETREHKEHSLPWEKLRRLWVSKLTQPELENLASLRWEAGDRLNRGEVPRRDVTAEQAMDYAARHVFERKSSAPAREVLAHALAYGVGAFDVEDAWKALENSDRFTARVDGRLMVASRSVMQEEQSIIRLASRGRATQSPINSGWEIQNTRLNIGQRAAVHHLLGSKDFVSMVIGDAGVGKTTLLKEAKQGAEQAGYRVLAFAPSASASRDTLRSEGFAGADTVARLLIDKQMQEQARGQVLLIDEAALLGTKESNQLFRLAKKLDARVWLVGDDKQHKSVSRGESFYLLQNKAGITPARVKKNMRQKNHEHRKAVEMSKTDPAAALAMMGKIGNLTEIADSERYQMLATDYLEAQKPARKGAKEKDVLVVAPTHAEGAKVTAAIREGLKEQGKLDEERSILQLKNLHLTEPEREDPHSYMPGDVLQFTQNAPGYRRGGRVEAAGGKSPPTHLAARFQVYRPGTLKVAKGDRLRVTKNGTSKDGHSLNNGSVLTVAGFTKSGDLLDHRGWVIPKDFGHLAHGYVTTSISSQGKSPDRVLLAMGTESLPATNREQLYVSLSRGKEWVKVYTDDAQALSRAVQKTDNVPSATDLAAMHKEEQKRLTSHVLEFKRRREYQPTPAHLIDKQRMAGLQKEMILEK